MNPGQEKFLNFILERVNEAQKEEVQTFMEANFEKQAAGTFGMKEIGETKEFLSNRIKPECQQEVFAVMQQFAGNFTK